MKPVRITTLAPTEIDAAASWFERRKEGLGVEFYQRVDEAVGRVEINPEGFQKSTKTCATLTLSSSRKELVLPHSG
jgi:hypothetical protein